MAEVYWAIKHPPHSAQRQWVLGKTGRLYWDLVILKVRLSIWRLR